MLLDWMPPGWSVMPLEWSFVQPPPHATFVSLQPSVEVDLGPLTRLLYLPHFNFPEHGRVDWPLVVYREKAADWWRIPDEAFLAERYRDG